MALPPITNIPPLTARTKRIDGENPNPPASDSSLPKLGAAGDQRRSSRTEDPSTLNLVARESSPAKRSFLLAASHSDRSIALMVADNNGTTLNTLPKNKLKH